MFGKYKTEAMIIDEHVTFLKKRNLFRRSEEGIYGISGENFINYLSDLPTELVDKLIDKIIEIVQEQRMNDEITYQREKIIRNKIREISLYPMGNG